MTVSDERRNRPPDQPPDPREVTIVVVTHNMQQAARVSDTCAFFLASLGTPRVIVEHGDTGAMSADVRDQRTRDYVNGRFG